ncbi:MAG: hypothetical protein LBC02_08280 [Planctomycetaceae bacterium]|jgi:hypothetical protein|nr:hypothetical protein [Planctomycetaceae bacterium]
MTKKFLFNVVTLCAIALFQNAFLLSDDEDIRELFLKEAPVKWQKYLDYCIRLEGEVIFRQYNPKDDITGEQLMTINNVFPQNTVEVSTNEDNDKNKRKIKKVKGYNSKYSFELEESESKAWKITSLTKIDAGLSVKDALELMRYTMPFKEEQSVKERGLSFFKSKLVPGVELTPLESLPLIVSLPEFNIKSISTVNVNKKKYVEIIYEFEPPSGKYPIVIGSGKFLLLPDTWLIKSGEFFRTGTSNSVIYYINNEYSFDNPSMPIVTKRVKKSFTKSPTGNNSPRTHEEAVYNLHETKNKNTKRFTLSYYGLPEPDFDERKPINRMRYVFVGLGLLFIGWGLWRVIQKRRKQV